MSVREELALREGAAADWPAIAALHAESWRSAYRGILSDAYLDGPVLADRETVWRVRLSGPADPGLIVMVAEAGGQLVGLACILAGDGRWGSLIDNLHVAPDRKGTGIGAAVLAAAAARMPTAYAVTPLHLTVFEANGPAKATYERWGGTLVERLVSREPDGRDHAVHRYLWDSPGDLMVRLRGRAAARPR